VHSGRLRLDYDSFLPPDHQHLWNDGLHHWLGRWQRSKRAALRSWLRAGLHWRRLLVIACAIPVIALAGWVHHAGHSDPIAQDQRSFARIDPPPEHQATVLALAALVGDEDHEQPPAALKTAEQTEAAVAESNPATARRWAPDMVHCDRHPSDHLPLPSDGPVELRVVTIRARVTAYTPYDHLRTRPDWADGVVAWHPNNRKRHVRDHRYGLATDWSQFPPGATFIRVPGYMSKTFNRFPENFRVVDDGCGAARKANRRGGQPVIDVRYMTRYSAIEGRNAWGCRELDVEVVFPEDFRIPASLRPWVVSEELRIYEHDGTRRR